jgi:hypothetical protein
MTELLTVASAQYSDCCFRQRYRVAWLTGTPMSGKSALARRLCEHHNWRYLNYTLTPGYFDALAPPISTYQPDQLIAALQDWASNCDAPVLVVDELDALLASWSSDQRHAWANKASRLPYAACGLILVSHFFNCSTLIRYLPDKDQRYCLDLAGVTL